MNVRFAHKLNILKMYKESRGDVYNWNLMLYRSKDNDNSLSTRAGFISAQARTEALKNFLIEEFKMSEHDINIS